MPKFFEKCKYCIEDDDRIEAGYNPHNSVCECGKGRILVDIAYCILLFVGALIILPAIIVLILYAFAVEHFERKK